jgi:hypothetical protein
MAIIGILLWLAYLGNPFESHHAKMSTSLVFQLQHLHVSTPSSDHHGVKG